MHRMHISRQAVVRVVISLSAVCPDLNPKIICNRLNSLGKNNTRQTIDVRALSAQLCTPFTEIFTVSPRDFPFLYSVAPLDLLIFSVTPYSSDLFVFIYLFTE